MAALGGAPQPPHVMFGASIACVSGHRSCLGRLLGAGRIVRAAPCRAAAVLRHRSSELLGVGGKAIFVKVTRVSSCSQHRGAAVEEAAWGALPRVARKALAGDAARLRSRATRKLLQGMAGPLLLAAWWPRSWKWVVVGGW